MKRCCRRLALGLLLAGLTGCLSEPPRYNDGYDPLTGGSPPLRGTSTSRPPPDRPELPTDLPSPHRGRSPAALASGDLRIPEGPAPVSRSGVQLRAPAVPERTERIPERQPARTTGETGGRGGPAPTPGIVPAGGPAGMT